MILVRTNHPYLRVGCHRYNILLGRDWVHASECIPSTLHQCVMQWVGDSMEVIPADDATCVAITESEVNIQGGRMSCLTGVTSLSMIM
jgi:hypothetical protein